MNTPTPTGAIGTALTIVNHPAAQHNTGQASTLATAMVAIVVITAAITMIWLRRHTPRRRKTDSQGTVAWLRSVQRNDAYHDAA